MVMVGLVAVCSGCITRNNEQRWDAASGIKTYENRGWGAGGIWKGSRPSEENRHQVGGYLNGPVYYNSGNYSPGGYWDVGGGPYSY